MDVDGGDPGLLRCDADDSLLTHFHFSLILILAGSIDVDGYSDVCLPPVRSLIASGSLTFDAPRVLSVTTDVDALISPRVAALYGARLTTPSRVRGPTLAVTLARKQRPETSQPSVR